MNHREKVRITNEIDRLERAQLVKMTTERAEAIKALKWVMELKV